MKLSQKIKWNITVFPALTHFIVAHNRNGEIKIFKTDGVKSVSLTKRIVKSLVEDAGIKKNLISMMVGVIKRQDRTRGAKRMIIGKQYLKVIELCDRFDIDWREVLRRAESEVYA